MLGLCWTPAAVQGMQKMATTMPTNPEQLLGAILVRKDIFHRFETTMHDTCLDANNLLEYLFSLYNSTAAPAERENFQTPQNVGFLRRDSNHNRKSSGRGQHTYNQNSQLPQSAYQNRLPDGSTRSHQAGSSDINRKKIKLDQHSLQPNVNYTGQHQNFNQSVSLKSFDTHPVHTGTRSNSLNPNNVKTELSAEMESRHAQSSSPLPPFSQIRRQASRPYSPGSAQLTENLATPPHDDGRHSLALDSGDVNIDVEGAIQEVLDGQQIPTGVPQSLPKASRKIKASVASSHDNNTPGSGERSGRKKRNHQCFCGALFTRADNLKRHIRKCHEEKLEKLNNAPLDFELEGTGAQITEFQSGFPSSGQEGVDTSQQPQDNQDPQQQQQQLLQQSQHDDHHHQQHLGEDPMKAASSSMKWSCFCGESFEDHRQLVEHTRTHESSA